MGLAGTLTFFLRTKMIQTDFTLLETPTTSSCQLVESTPAGVVTLPTAGKALGEVSQFCEKFAGKCYTTQRWMGQDLRDIAPLLQVRDDLCRVSPLFKGLCQRSPITIQRLRLVMSKLMYVYRFYVAMKTCLKWAKWLQSLTVC